VFVSYFPLLVAGPIERATHLLPQLKVKREFKYNQGLEGCRLILWGMFKKVVIADSIAPLVNEIFSNYQNHNSVTLIIGLIGFAFQVYGDFSGYTDIARGVSKLFGIELILNFNFPYFSKSIPEFWSRWHISLSSWLNDYVFTPLALNFRNWNKHGIFLAVFLTFIISGLWHGAAWHFIAWGAYHGLLYLPSIYSKKGFKSIVKKKNDDHISWRDIPKILLTFTLVCFGYLLFRADGMNAVVGYIKQIVESTIKNPAQFLLLPDGKMVFLYIIPLILGDLFFKKNIDFSSINKIFKYAFYILIGYLIIVFYNNKLNFIYFEF
jgi:D-alanyl-lipoteichoic acid acyltransferase DltB (MBOAT superfamily)